MSETANLPDLSGSGTGLARLLDLRPEGPSVVGGASGEAALEIQGAGAAALLDGEVVDEGAARAVQAGLLVWHDADREARALLEGLGTPEAACWTAIAFRKEGDTGSANYWWHRAGRHPFFEPLTERAVVLLQGQEGPLAEFRERIARRGWDTGNFVELTRRVRENIAGAAETAQTLGEVQRAELLTLLDWCARKALGR